MAHTVLSRIEKAAEACGWGVSTTPTGSRVEFEFNRFSPAGQDFAFSSTMTGNDPATLIKDIDEYIDSFDPDYEATFWQKDGHGINGAPYRLKDIITDFEAAGEMLEQLLDNLIEEFQQ